MKSSTEDIKELLENEWYVVRYSGEVPEIAYNSAIYFLTRSAKGPKLRLTKEQEMELKLAAVQRYREIVIRDLQLSNLEKPIYRGIARSICNYQRFCNFCSRQAIDPGDVKMTAADALRLFLEGIADGLQKSTWTTELNCTFDELSDYAEELQVEFLEKFLPIRRFCTGER